MSFSEAYESAAILAEMQEALRESDAGRRSARVWRLINLSAPHNDASIVRDFAMDHNLISELDSRPRRLERGLVLNSSWRNPCDGSDMIWVPPGPCLLGRPNPRRPAVATTMAGFSLARHPVTNAQFR